MNAATNCACMCIADATKRPKLSDVIDPTELRIVIIDKTGTGKSATGNTILGRREFESKVCGASITNKCKLGMNTRFDRKIVVVDTSGLYDTGMTNGQVTKEIVKCIGMTAPGPHAILLTVNVGRFTKEEQDTVKHFVDHFGIGSVDDVVRKHGGFSYTNEMYEEAEKTLQRREDEV
ncbi:Hypothetical predicted protein [Mytilus galloprovincialis]|uniref:AIG1-type G domain-containing protein n=1 Tax=Mytilus galloprovincialis TaxID=29158 RepID=A0A8B6CIV2_MYTGA|nr:Hypothetical predicted protein [Mytilus galloprovincialis]